MSKVILSSLCLILAACSKAASIDGQYYRSNATPFEQQYGMAKGLLIENNGQKVTLQHNWGNVSLNVKADGKSLVVLDEGEPEYIISVQDNKAVISSVDAEYPSNEYEFLKDKQQ